MSESNRKVIRQNSVESISTEIGLRAIAAIAPIAESEKIDWALAGGMAMHVYGFTRATVDVDVVASAVLTLEKQKSLSFGGESYQIQVGENLVTVDWIVRADEFEKLYRLALADFAETESGVKIISPAWLVILKFFSGRAKTNWIYIGFCSKDLVEREEVKSNLTKVVGEDAVFYLWQEFQSEFDYADFLKMREANSKYK